MSRKQFVVLVLALIVLGGAGFALFWQDISDYRASGAKIGAKLLPSLKVADVAQVRLRDAKSGVTLVRKENSWVVQERNGYSADFKAISDLIIKLADLKVVQSEAIGESLLSRVELVEPGKGEGAGTQIELRDAAGKTLANLVLGKIILKKDPGNPLPNAQNGVPAGRYVRFPEGKDRVVVVSDPLSIAEAQPGRWLDKEFFKADRIKTLAVANEGGAPWKITRDVEWGQWKFASGGGNLDASSAVGAVNALGNLTFNDVALDVKPDNPSRGTVTAETFDNLVYTLRIGKATSGEDYLVGVTVSGEPPRERQVEKDEKAEQKAQRDKDFAENRKRLESRMGREKALAQWTYVVEAKQIAPLLKTREQMVAQRKPNDENGQTQPAGPKAKASKGKR
ncbi:MAG: DUF4340 domain-containing protein [Burkholderiales bacterium]